MEVTPTELARHRHLWLVLGDIEATRETGDWDSEYQRDQTVREAKQCARILYTGRV